MQWTDGLPNTCWANIPLRRSLTRVEWDENKYIKTNISGPPPRPGKLLETHYSGIGLEV